MESSGRKSRAGLAEDTTPESLLVPLGKFCLKVSRRPALECEQIQWIQGIAAN